MLPSDLQMHALYVPLQSVGFLQHMQPSLHSLIVESYMVLINLAREITDALPSFSNTLLPQADLAITAADGENVSGE